MFYYAIEHGFKIIVLISSLQNVPFILYLLTLDKIPSLNCYVNFEKSFLFRWSL